MSRLAALPALAEVPRDAARGAWRAVRARTPWAPLDTVMGHKIAGPQLTLAGWGMIALLAGGPLLGLAFAVEWVIGLGSEALFGTCVGVFCG